MGTACPPPRGVAERTGVVQCAWHHHPPTEGERVSEDQVAAIVAADYPSTGQLISIAINRASDASAANGWHTTRWAWELADSTRDGAEDYWLTTLTEDPERARYEVAEALVAVGWTIRTVWNVLS